MPDRRPHDGPVARVWAAVVGELLRGKPPRVPLDRQNRVHAVERHDLGIVDAPKVRIRDVDATASVGRDLVQWLGQAQVQRGRVDEAVGELLAGVVARRPHDLEQEDGAAQRVRRVLELLADGLRLAGHDVQRRDVRPLLPLASVVGRGADAAGVGAHRLVRLD